jgi:hypothetical protein
MTVLFIPTGEEPVELAGVFEPLVDDRRKIGEGERVFLEPQIVFENVIDDPAEKGDIRPRPQGRVDVA